MKFCDESAIVSVNTSLHTQGTEIEQSIFTRIMREALIIHGALRLGLLISDTTPVGLLIYLLLRLSVAK